MEVQATSLKLYPLTPAQQLSVREWKYAIHKQVMNIPTSILVQDPLDLDLLKKAVEAAIKRNDSFGIRITKRGKELLHYYGEREALLLETIDFTGQTMQKMEAFFEKIGRTPSRFLDRPLAKIYIVQAPDGTAGLFTCMCHLMMDTWAISIFYRDVFSIYSAMLAGEPMPAPLVDFESTIQKDEKYLKSDRYQKDLDFWRAEIAGDGSIPKFTHIAGTGLLDSYRRLIRKPDHPFGSCLYLRTTAKIEVQPVPKSDVEEMLRYLDVNKAGSLQLLFLFGLRTCLSRVNGRVDDVTVTNVIGRRATFAEKKAGGTRPAGIFIRSIIDENATFADALARLGEKQASLFRHSDVPFADLVPLMCDTWGMKLYESNCTAMFTFQNYPMELDNRMKFRARWYCKGTQGISFYMMVLGGVPDSLECYYQYLDKQISAEWLRRCHRYILDVIRTGIRNPSITVKELLDLPL